METNEFYEKIEDGFLTPQDEVNAKKFEAVLPRASLEEIKRDYGFARRQAFQATGLNKINWETIRDLALARWQLAYTSPEHLAERELVEEVERANLRR